MHTGKVIVTENGHEESAVTTVNTGNFASVMTVPADSVNREMFQNRPATENRHKQYAVTNVNTGVSVMDAGDVSADSVTRESVPKQAAENQTAKNTTSAVNSSLDQNVKAASEITGTVSGSVHIRRRMLNWLRNRVHINDSYDSTHLCLFPDHYIGRDADQRL